MTLDEVIKKLNSYNSNLVKISVHFITKKVWFQTNNKDYNSTQLAQHSTKKDFEQEPLLYVDSSIELHLFLNTNINTIEEYLEYIDQLLDDYKFTNSDIFKIKQGLDSSDTKERRLLNIVKNINFVDNVD